MEVNRPSVSPKLLILPAMHCWLKSMHPLPSGLLTKPCVSSFQRSQCPNANTSSMVVPSNHRLFFYHFTIRIIVFLLFLVVHYTFGCNGCICPEQRFVQFGQCQAPFPARRDTPHHAFCFLHFQSQVRAVCCFRNIKLSYRIHLISSMGRCRPVCVLQMPASGCCHLHSGWPCVSGHSHRSRSPGQAVHPCARSHPLSSAGSGDG